jgi:PASTA domain
VRAHGSMDAVDDRSTPDAAGERDNESDAANSDVTDAGNNAKQLTEDRDESGSAEDGGGATQVVSPDPDATKSVPSDPDATRLVQPDPDATRIVKSDPDATVVTPQLRPGAPDSTAVLQPSTSAAGATAPQARWSGYAPVRVQPARDLDATAQWQPPEPRRAWWLPILLGIIGLVLLIAIAFAVVAALNNSSDNAPPVPAPTATATSPSQAPSTPSSTPPTSTPPTTPSAVGTFSVPSILIGLQITDAESLLDSYGISYTAVPQPDDNALPNTVVGTSPQPGQVLPAGGGVTLYYAQPSTPSSPATSAPAVSPSPSS